MKLVFRNNIKEINKKRFAEEERLTKEMLNMKPVERKLITKRGNDMKKEIVNYLLSCGIKPSLKGFNYLHRAIEITMANDNVMPPVTKILYPQIAEEFNDTYTRVERSIRHAIGQSKKDYKHMSNGVFIATASILISVTKK